MPIDHVQNIQNEEKDPLEASHHVQMPDLDTMGHYLFSKSIVNELLDKVDRHIVELWNIKTKLILGDMRITRSRAKKRIQGEPICVPKNMILHICEEIVKLFYGDALDFKDMRLRTSGPE